MRIRSRVASEDGAILVQAALAMVTLLAFSSFVVDYGVMWVGRGQAQNAADAGALAGATALAFDSFTDRTGTGPAKVAANTMALQHRIWGVSPVSLIARDVTFPTVPAICEDTSCIRVDVYRNQTMGSALPTFFGLAAGVTDQGVRAMAIARAAVGSASTCLKPWAVPDKWLDNDDSTLPIDNAWTPDDVFDRYDGSGNVILGPDVYIPPSHNGPGTGFTIAQDLGTRMILKPGSPSDAIAPGWFFPIDLPRVSGPSSGGQKYRENIATCNGVLEEIGDSLTVENGNMIGPTGQGVADLIALDPNAQWDPVGKRVINSCAQSSTPCAARSPRIVPLPVFDPDVYQAGKHSGKIDISIVNILGYFIDDMVGSDVIGYLVLAPGVVTGGAPFGFESAFLRSLVMVR
ncbi:MAG: pilus assembly protein TadG-related protein [Vicinamibacterales bacterium]